MPRIAEELRASQSLSYTKDTPWNTRTERMPAVKVPPVRVKVQRSLWEKISLTLLLVTDRAAASAIMRLEELAAERRSQVQHSSSKSHFLR
jgi:hypothetical protein